MGILTEADPSVIKRMQKRAALFHESKESRAAPLAASALESPALAPEMKMIATSRLASGLRRSSLLSLSRSSFHVHPSATDTFLKVRITFAKTSTDTMVRHVPTRLALLVIRLFPVSEDYVDVLTKMAGAISEDRKQRLHTSHSLQ